MEVFEKIIKVQEDDLDDLNHVNNVRYVQWMQDIAKGALASQGPGRISEHNGLGSINSPHYL